MRKQKTSKPFPRRPKPKKCAARRCIECANCKPLRDRLKESLNLQWNTQAERDEARKQHLVAAQRNVELTEENRKLQAFKDLALGLAQRDLAGNLHIKAEDVKNCLQ